MNSRVLPTLLALACLAAPAAAQNTQRRPPPTATARLDVRCASRSGRARAARRLFRTR